MYLKLELKSQSGVMVTNSETNEQMEVTFKFLQRVTGDSLYMLVQNKHYELLCNAEKIWGKVKIFDAYKEEQIEVNMDREFARIMRNDDWTKFTTEDMTAWNEAIKSQEQTIQKASDIISSLQQLPANLPPSLESFDRSDSLWQNAIVNLPPIGEVVLAIVNEDYSIAIFVDLELEFMNLQKSIASGEYIRAIDIKNLDCNTWWMNLPQKPKPLQYKLLKDYATLALEIKAGTINTANDWQKIFPELDIKDFENKKDWFQRIS